MALFKKPVTTPNTVTEAIQPFRQVQENLIIVLGKAMERKDVAAKRIADAEAYAAQVKTDETAAADAAAAEAAQAKKIADALANLLGD